MRDPVTSGQAGSDLPSEESPRQRLPTFSYLFGPFEFRDWPAQLFEKGRQIPLQPQPARCLELLLDRAGELVERDQIRDHIWDREIHLNHDQGINYIIRVLRTALRDESQSPTYIETVPRRGYRFLAKVEKRLLVEQPKTPARPRPTLSMPRWQVFAAVVLPVLALVLLFFGRERSPRGSFRSEPLKSIPITVDSATVRQPDLSPDGLHVAYSRYDERSGSWDIFIQAVDNGAPLRVTGDQGSDSRPRWSPEGDRVAFLRTESDGRCRLVSVPVLGGRETEILDAGFECSPDFDWSSDGRSMVFPVPGSFPDAGGTAVFGIETRSLEVFEGAPEMFDSMPVISPDGRRLAFLRGPHTRVRDIFVRELSEGRVQQLTFDQKAVTGLAWVSSDQLAFSSNRVGLPALWLLDVESHALVWLPIRHDVIHDPSVAAGRVAFSSWQIHSTIRRQEVGRQDAALAVTPFSTEAWESLPSYSPDGSRVAFVSHRGGSPEVWLFARSEEQTRRLTDLGVQMIESLDWSPDGLLLLLAVRVDQHPQFFIVEVESGDFHRLPLGPESHWVGWAGDRQHLLVSSDREDAAQIWKVSLQRDEWSRLTENGGATAREVGDFLYFTKPSRPGLFSLARSSTTESEVVMTSKLLDGNLWGVVDAHLFFVDVENGLAVLKIFDPDDRTFRTPTILGSEIIESVSVSPDFSTVLSGRIDRFESDVHFVELEP